MPAYPRAIVKPTPPISNSHTQSTNSHSQAMFTVDISMTGGLMTPTLLAMIVMQGVSWD